MGQRSVSGALGLALTLLGGGMNFAFPGMIIPPVWGWFMIASGGLLLLWTAMSWIWAVAWPSFDFESVKAWSVSVELKGLQRGELPDGRPYGLLHVELINHSSTQSRVLDISMLLDLPNDKNLHYAMTSGPPVTDRQDQVKALNVSRWLKEAFIPVPVTIPPNGRLWGYIEMATSTSDTKAVVLEVQLSEVRSGIKKTLLPGECFDALRQKAYVGRLGHPPSRFRMRRVDYKMTKYAKGRRMRAY